MVSISSCVVFLGFISLAKHTLTLLKWIYITFLRPPKNLTTYGSWALITGATDGIGKAFAFQLAKKGLNLILISRNHDKLKTVSSAIQAQNPNTKIKIVVLDFSREWCKLVIEEAIKGLDVGVLINNVGVTYPSAMYFDEVEENVWRDVVRVNVEGITVVTKAVLPGMAERKRGAVVNIGSAAGICVPSHPLYAIYGASKTYIHKLSRCLDVEYKHYGVSVQCQVPFYVATKMSSRVASIQRPSFFIPTPEEYARAAVNRIGYEAVCIPFWSHSIQCFFADLLPHFVLDYLRLSIGIKRRRANSTTSSHD